MLSLGAGAASIPYRDHQERVDSYFDSASSYWAEVYSARSVEGAIYQQRKAVALRWIDELALPQGSRILEVGCGAGLMTIELARRGYVVESVDSSEAMVANALRNVAESGVGDRVKVFRGDVNSLSFEDDLFSLVLAMGVIPWVESPGVAVREMARVVKPGGYIILSSDNRARLSHVDPRFNPALRPLRGLLKRPLEATGLRRPRSSSSVPAHFHSNSYIDRVILQNHLEKMKTTTLGFGPFTFLGRTLLPDSVGIGLHRRLQALADRGVAGIRSSGAQYLVLARALGFVDATSRSLSRTRRHVASGVWQPRELWLRVWWRRAILQVIGCLVRPKSSKSETLRFSRCSVAAYYDPDAGFGGTASGIVAGERLERRAARSGIGVRRWGVTSFLRRGFRRWKERHR